MNRDLLVRLVGRVEGMADSCGICGCAEDEHIGNDNRDPGCDGSGALAGMCGCPGFAADEDARTMLVEVRAELDAMPLCRSL